LGQTLAERTQQEAKQQRRHTAEVCEEEARVDRNGRSSRRQPQWKVWRPWETSPDEAMGIGHPTGGTEALRDNLIEILNRLRLRSTLLPQEFDNVWIVSKWDKTRVDKFEGVFEGHWGVTFRDIIVGFLARSRDGEKHAVEDWMQDQCRTYLFGPRLPVLRL
jgi:hypothetical protein